MEAGNLTEAQVEKLLKNLRIKGKNIYTARNSREKRRRLDPKKIVTKSIFRSKNYKCVSASG